MSNESRFIDIGLRLNGWSKGDNSMPNPWSGTIWGQIDSPITQLIKSSWLVLPGIDYRVFYGKALTGDHSQSPQRRASEQIHQVAYHDYQDWLNYAWPIGELLHRGLDPLSGSAPTFEKQVNHTSLRGRLRPEGVSLYKAYEGHWLLNGRDILISSDGSNLGTFWTYRTVDNASIGVIQNRFTDSSWTGIRGSISRMFDSYINSPSPTSDGSFYEDFAGAKWHRTVGTSFSADRLGSLTYSIGDRGLTASWETIRSTAIRRMQTWRTLSLHVTPLDQSVLAFRDYGGRMPCRVTGSVVDYTTCWNLVGGLWTIAPGYANRMSSSNISYIAVDRNFHVVSRRYDSEPLEALVARRIHVDNIVRGMAPDIRPGSCISTNDAMEKLKTSSNWVETFAEASSLTGVITGPIDLVRQTMAVISNPRVTLARFLWLMADTISSAHLQASFVYKPLADDIPNAVTLASRLRALSHKLSKGMLTYGSHRVEVDIESQTFDIEFRTKVYIPPLSVDAIKGLMEVDSSGALPTFSRVWNARPFSFILDYFVKVGDRLDVIQTYLWLCLARASLFVHSYKLSSRLDTFQFNDGYEWLEGNCEYTFYQREKSIFVSSPLRSTRFNLLPPRGPSAMTAVSLIFQLAKSFFAR